MQQQQLVGLHFVVVAHAHLRTVFILHQLDVLWEYCSWDLRCKFGLLPPKNGGVEWCCPEGAQLFMGRSTADSS